MHLEGGAFSQAQKDQTTTELFNLGHETHTRVAEPSLLSLSTATDPLCSVIRLCFWEEILQLFPLLLAVVMAGHMPHVSAF